MSEELAGAILLGKAVDALRKKVSATPNIPKSLSDLGDELLTIQMQAIQAANLANSLLQENRTLKDENEHLKDFAAKAEQYALRPVSVGVFAQVRKDSVGTLKAAEKLCAACFAEKKETVLQLQKGPHREQMLVCQRGHAPLSFYAWADDKMADDGPKPVLA